MDYDDTSPLSTFPCKGYRAQAPVQTVRASTSIPGSIGGDAPRNGGHCQFALSYDGEKTWVVVETVTRDCLRDANRYTMDVPIPKSAPAGTAVFAWTWVNAVGNREYYMACTDLVMNNPDATAALTGPEMLIANLPGYDMREVFEKRRVITVRGNGAVPPPPVSTATAKPTPTTTTTTTKKPGKDQKDLLTSTAVATTSTAAPKPTTTAAPKPKTTAAPKPITSSPKPTTATSSTRSTRVPKPTTTTTALSKPTPTDANCIDGTWRCAGNGKLMG
ncbi:hypothetical protein AMAG_20341 [Allomyces macrogynus ATCC 38327]|uniref:Chitin-binding type-4 domain-containing protein n=1 Tax=Allomyces macrogynus (strain ATCC 38327) TaxID=578462 RepID=A0A0L0T9D7_ALLM3|nr:hypothetical protein AMAG_20341 [Allomyces macrogynus ATCC 38327]|eukprot:KNE71362.1 hypothetical protein AMAG_20341 [Allomyces macrogynus ATCC 38327]